MLCALDGSMVNIQMKNEEKKKPTTATTTFDAFMHFKRHSNICAIDRTESIFYTSFDCAIRCNIYSSYIFAHSYFFLSFWFVFHVVVVVVYFVCLLLYSVFACTGPTISRLINIKKQTKQPYRIPFIFMAIK